MIKKAYRDWTEYLEAIEQIDKDTMRHYFASQRDYDEDTWDQALTMAYRGWPEGTGNVASISIPQVETMARRKVDGSTWVWDVTGANYDVGEMLSGVPECWQSVEPTETKPVVKVVVSLGIAGGIPDEVITYRGAGIIALVIALQQAGYVVDLVAARHAIADNVHVQVTVPLVDVHGGPLDLDRLAFVLMHPWATRVLFFRLTGHLMGNATAWLGMPQQVTEQGDLNLPPLLYDQQEVWKSREKVNAWVQQEFNRITGGSQ